MTVTEELRIAEIPDIDVDPVTLDIIEGALRARASRWTPSSSGRR